jgi:LDH2 family malate/lactate/ureidoglycolate dehydrogenase
MIEPSRYRAPDLVALARGLLAAAGVPDDRAGIIAGCLVEADLMGHTTHGLALLAPYLDELASGAMVRDGEPETVRDTGACLTWDGRRLPGVWLTAHAIDAAVARAPTYGTATVVIRNSHHIACLGAFLTRATDRGLMILLVSSDPAAASVAPFGGVTAVFTPDPIAVGIPTGRDPILIDTSASITTNGMSGRLHKESRRFPHRWLLDAEGAASDDPAVLFADPPGTILPAGGLDHGHKGYALALLVEALTQGLGGFGRAEAPGGWGASVFVQVLDPAAFGGADGFVRETGWIADACRGSRPRPGVDRVRLPGEAALARRREALADGVVLYPGIIDGLAAAARRHGLTVPQPL